MNQMLVSVHFTDEKTEEKKILHFLTIARASLVVQMEKNLPAMQEIWVQFLGQEDSLEKGMATHYSILAWKSHGLRRLVVYSPWGHNESDTT